MITSKQQDAISKKRIKPSQIREHGLTLRRRKLFDAAIAKSAFVEILGLTLASVEDIMYVRQESLASIRGAGRAITSVCRELFGVRLEPYVVVKGGRALIPLVVRDAENQCDLIPEDDRVQAVLRAFRRLMEAGAENLSNDEPVMIPEEYCEAARKHGKKDPEVLVTQGVRQLVKLKNSGVQIALKDQKSGRSQELRLPDGELTLRSAPSKFRKAEVLRILGDGEIDSGQYVVTTSGVALRGVWTQRKKIRGNKFAVTGSYIEEKMTLRVFEVSSIEADIQRDLPLKRPGPKKKSY